MKSKAVGFLDTQISCMDQANNEHAIRETARPKHYDLARLFASTHLIDDPIKRLVIMLGRVDADTLIVPGISEHLGRDVAAMLNQTYRIIETPRIPGVDATVWEPHTMMVAAR